MTLTNEQIAKALYGICQIYGASSAQLAGENFRCGFDNKNKALLNALTQACEARSLTYRIEIGQWSTNFELIFL